MYEWERNRKRKVKLPPNVVASFEKWSSPNDTSFTAMSNQLKIPKVKRSYEDYYCCVAINACGNTKSCAWLEVDSKLSYNHYVICRFIINF